MSGELPLGAAARRAAPPRWRLWRETWESSGRTLEQEGDEAAIRAAFWRLHAADAPGGVVATDERGQDVLVTWAPKPKAAPR